MTLFTAVVPRFNSYLNPSFKIKKIFLVSGLENKFWIIQDLTLWVSTVNPKIFPFDAYP